MQTEYGDINTWDVSRVKDFSRVFGRGGRIRDGASEFNQNIGSWQTSAATAMDYMFWKGSNFNQNLDGWQISNVKSFAGAFGGAHASVSVAVLPQSSRT